MAFDTKKMQYHAQKNIGLGIQDISLTLEDPCPIAIDKNKYFVQSLGELAFGPSKHHILYH
jgi:hypothetical protein